MKIHPLLEGVIRQAFSPPSERSHAAWVSWEKAGKPVAEEEGNEFAFRLDNGTWINLRGTINLDVYPEIRRAILREHMTIDDIGDVELLENDTIARIVIRGRGKPHHVGLGYSGGTAYDIIQRKVIR